ncbi:MAG: heavy metal-responsive transcriptional regulator [Zoogloeaceae bacterium]|jgi:MerR family copper efflux transcriptional regulator|nr:heavy metal-responsive transcriptional regulator [Zoogloeaceae bacterium]
MNEYHPDKRSRRMPIGDLAKKTGVSPETLRYYEHEGLLSRPPRNASGYREYDEDAVGQVRFILRAKNLGFSLEEIVDLLKFSTNAECATARVNQQLTEIEEQIARLENIRARLASLVAVCPHGCAPVECCPILSAMQTEKGETDSPPSPEVSPHDAPDSCRNTVKTGLFSTGSLKLD